MKPALLFAYILITVLFAGNCYAQEQEQKKESYKSLKSRSSRTGIEQLFRTANELKTSNPSQALNNVQDALSMSMAQSDGFNEAKCYLLLGEINENIQEWGLALDNYEHAYQKLYKNYSNAVEYQYTLRGLGNTYLKLGNYSQALRYFQETLNLSLSDLGKTERQLDVSEVYFQMGNYQEALRVIEGSESNLKNRNEVIEGKIQNQKAKIYT